LSIARDASAAMMLLTAKTEKEFEVVAFSEGLKELNVNREDTLETAIAECSRHDFSSTDCALPWFKAKIKIILLKWHLTMFHINTMKISSSHIKISQQ
jgi:hypothetical protein